MAKVPKVNFNSVTSNAYKVKKVASNITGEIKSTGHYYRGNFLYGWEAASRLSKIKKHNKLQSLICKLYGATSKTKIKNEHIPTILGGIGAVSPIPGGSILGYGIGKIVNKLIKYFK